MHIRAAFATDDGETFIKRHFGDAEYYLIYDIDPAGCRFVKKIENTTEEEQEEVHADPKKAKGVARMLQNEGVTTAVCPVFGPNIKRIRKKFVCILTDAVPIDQAAEVLRNHYSEIEAEWNKGEDRKHLRFSS